jgi:hypothetical protein
MIVGFQTPGVVQPGQRGELDQRVHTPDETAVDRALAEELHGLLQRERPSGVAVADELGRAEKSGSFRFLEQGADAAPNGS